MSPAKREIRLHRPDQVRQAVFLAAKRLLERLRKPAISVTSPASQRAPQSTTPSGPQSAPQTAPQSITKTASQSARPPQSSEPVDPAPQAPAVAAAFKEASMRLIGHAPTRPASYPDWLIASGRSDPALLLSAALTDVRDAVWRGDLERSFGLRRPDALQLQPSPALSPLIAAELQSRIDDILAARIQVAPAPQGSAGRATTRPGSGAASSLPPSGANSPTTGPGAGEPAPANH